MANRITFSDIFTSKAYDFTTTLTIGEIILSLGITLLMSIVIYLVYKRTFSGVFYSKNFNITLVSTSLVTTAIMMAISGSLALSLGMVGALSIIRFRTAVKDPRDIAFLFWAISTGIINGVGLFSLSAISSVIIGSTIVFLSKIRMFLPTYLIIIKSTPGNLEKIQEKIHRKSRRINLRNITSSHEEEEICIELKLKEGDQGEIIKSVKGIGGVKRVTLMSYSGDLVE